MKHSMHNWMRPEPIEVTLERLHRFGYDGIEISGEPARYDTDEVRRLMDRYQLECWGSVTMMFEGRDLVHPDDTIRRESVQYIKDSLDMTKRLGGRVFCIVPSTVGKTRPLASIAQEWAWAVEGLKEVTEYAGELGIVPGIEPLNRFETYFINRHDQALLLCEEVGNNLGVVLDAFHINIEEADPVQAIRNVGSKLVDFHVADNNRRPAGKGHFDWARIVEALREIGYEGHLTAEFVLTLDRTPIALMSEKRESDMTINEADLKFINDMGSGLISGADYDRAVETSIATLKSHL
ncbi:MAG: sugar phosphate isomerase/epimerase family protein [Acidobacteriota bacterium]